MKRFKDVFFSTTNRFNFKTWTPYLNIGVLGILCSTIDVDHLLYYFNLTEVARTHHPYWLLACSFLIWCVTTSLSGLFTWMVLKKK
jgi:hypothetical protein